MVEYVKEQIEICKCHWKTIAVGSFMLHFIFDWIVLAVGILIGVHIGHH